MGTYVAAKGFTLTRLRARHWLAYNALVLQQMPEGFVMTGVMLVKQRVANIEQWNTVFSNPDLDAVRRQHGLVVTGTYVDADERNTTIIVVMDMHDLDTARQFAASPELASAREQAGAIGSPAGVWYGANQVQ